MKKRLERWDALLLLAQSDREIGGDQIAVDLLNKFLIASIREYHYGIIPTDLALDASELGDIPEIAKDWAITTQYSGVTNDYLEKRLESRGHQVEVVGEEPKLKACKCCGYKTLPVVEGAVCPVCLWEHDGSKFSETSEVNGMSLKEGRDNFHSIGAKSVEARKNVPKDGPSRYRLG